MSGAGEKIAKIFPGTPWTGKSGIHRSLAASLHLSKQLTPRQVMKLLIHQNAGKKVWNLLHKYFDMMEWLVSEEEFTALMLQDVYGHLQGQGSTKSPKMLKNPVTGNVFHRMALVSDIVGGIRYWTHGYQEICFRFRLERQMEEEDKTRNTIRAMAEAAVVVMEDLKVELELSQPQTEEEEKVMLTISID